jgi:molybdopterin converting factor small subunit
MISIIFISVDENVHYSLICKNTDTINSVETRLYREYPELSNTENNFLYKGKKMNKLKKFEDYKIKNGDIITIIQK